jgi:xanthine dehydrogenase small subunit
MLTLDKPANILIAFILNNKEVRTDLPPGMLLLDFVRYHQHLTGTKIGCREGDCGACAVLIGELIENKLRYRSATSCLTAIGNVQHKHVVTIEGLNMQSLNPLQEAICREGGTQCGFCTPGFIVSMAGFCLSEQEPTYNNAVAAVDGNICRCTGYKSIQRALNSVATLMQQKKASSTPIQFATEHNILPAWFATIKERLRVLSLQLNGVLEETGGTVVLGGGTDLYVQQHENMVHAPIHFLFNQDPLKGIAQEDNRCIIGGAATVTDLMESPIIGNALPGFKAFCKLVSSTPIRNIATLAGNFINASPIGDFTIFFLALDATIVLKENDNTRELPLRKLYKGYKTLDKTPGEYIEKIWFELPAKNSLFNFEKVSKRTYLDIASVNSAISLTVEGETITAAGIATGGVGPVPMYLPGTSSLLQGEKISTALIEAAIATAQTEISPIGDARGSVEYKRLLLAQLIKAHFITLFPKINQEMIIGI